MNQRNGAEMANPAASVREEKALFGGESFELLWSCHAKRRISTRGAISIPLADQFLRFSLARAEQEIGAELTSLSDSCTIFDKVSDLFTVLHINRKKHKMYVMTYGDASEMYPRWGDTVIQFKEQGKIRLLNWTFQKKDPVLTDVYCKLNGKTLRLRWTRYTTNRTKNRDVRKISEQNLRAIADVISNAVKILPEEQTMNIWDWRSGVFVSVRIPAEGDTLDVILFRTADFVSDSDIYTRVDITDQGCTVQRAE